LFTKHFQIFPIFFFIIRFFKIIFYYATTAGVSINIEDLKTPDIKRDIKKANQEIVDISQQWQQGFVSDTRVLLIVGILPNR
jgi:hypothetical protein